MIKWIIGKCVIRRKYAAKSDDQLIAQHPADRITQSPPFSIIGVHFSGPMFVKSQERESSKSYIALFTCATTRAVHMELVTSMSTKSFLSAFRCFLSRNSACKIIYYDTVKSFKDDNKKFQYFTKVIDYQELQDFVSSQGITWKFFNERAPWWGGFYERLVKSVKEPLRKILGRAHLSFNELSTILSEIE